MNKRCISDYSSEEYSEKKKEENDVTTNRISLNFVKEYKHPAKDRYNQEKVKSLFKCLQQRQDLQELKVSGWLDDGNDDRDSQKSKGEEEDGEEYKCGLESYYGEGEESPRRGGQRFLMSRDFWYRTLNTLKAQKLDEVALEAKDIPPSDKPKAPKCIRYLKSNKIFADEVPVTKAHVIKDIDIFNESLKKRCKDKNETINIYGNRKHLLNRNLKFPTGNDSPAK